MVAHDYERAIEYAMQLSPEQKLRLLAHIANALDRELAHGRNTDVFWTDEEIAELMQSTPMSGAEIASAPEIGSWSDLDISDSAKWLKQRHQQQI